MTRPVLALLFLAACESAQPLARPSITTTADLGPSAPAPPRPPAGLLEGLDGIWVVGGSLAPRTWMIAGDALTEIDPDGSRRTYQMRAVAPCQLELTSAATRMRRWVSYALIEGTLYAGSGAIGTLGNDAIVCTQLGVYDLGDAGCTMWTPPALAASDTWIAHPATCGHELGDRWFYVSDRDSAPPAAAPFALYRHRGVLMSTAQAVTPAERATSESSALARARALAEISGRAELPAPFPHPFDAWPLSVSQPQTFQNEEIVWAAAMNREDQWEIGLMFFGGRSGSAIALASVWPRLAPAPFVHPGEPRVAMEPATPVMYAEREGVKYGRFSRTSWDHLKVAVLREGREYDHGVDFTAARALRPGHWELGSPAAYRGPDAGWRPLQVVARDGDTVFGLDRGVLRALPLRDVRLVEIGERFPAGTEVLAVPVASAEAAAFEPAVVAETLGNGAGYVVVGEGDEWAVSFEHVMLRDPDQIRLPWPETGFGGFWPSRPK